jgi:hypothetical protein
MNINRRLFEETKPMLWDYGCNEDEFEAFLFKQLSFLHRQTKAIQIIDTIMRMHGKEELLHHVAELARIEHGIKELEPWVRDHVVHALLCFLLGIKINGNFFPVTHSHKIKPFQWKLAGLFHDIGYPLQIAKDIINPYTKKVNDIKRSLGVNTPDIQFQIVPIGLHQLQNNQNSFALIQHCLDQWQLDINAQDEFDRMVQSGNTCHGIISALTVLYVIDLMYEKYNPDRVYRDTYLHASNINWNQKNFKNQVIPACSAIYIHNLPSDRFIHSKIDPEIAPLPFLLKLTDTLQEWERPSLNNIHGYSSDEFDFEFNNNNFVFHVNNSGIRNRIQDEINQTLISTRIIIS